MMQVIKIPYLIFFIIITIMIFEVVSVFAAVAPLEPKNLNKKSDFIVSGTVINILKTNQKSKIEKSFGIHRDQIFNVTLKVTKVSKGEGVKINEHITIKAWRPLLRIPPIPGPQGHYPLPEIGDKVKVFLIKEANGKYSALLPNGFSIIN